MTVRGHGGVPTWVFAAGIAEQMFAAALRVSTAGCPLDCWPAAPLRACRDSDAGGACTPAKSEPIVSVTGPLAPKVTFLVCRLRRVAASESSLAIDPRPGSTMIAFVAVLAMSNK